MMEKRKMRIKAPFNFIPVSDEVFFPNWADKIHHDIPFSDGISGSFKLKLTAKSPVFVRNGHTSSDQQENNNTYNSFSNISGQHFIPATSLKGTIRNVLEIMSFSKLSLDEKAKFAQREWSNDGLYNLKKEQQDLRCGWLKRKDHNSFVIEDCGTPYRIGHKRIDEWLGRDQFSKYFSKKNNFGLNKEHTIDGKAFDPKSASFKYHLVGNKNLSNLYFDDDKDFNNKHNKNRLKVVNKKSGDIRGTIVFTGQPDSWHDRPLEARHKKNAGKFYEFVFKKEIENIYSISEKEFDHFKFIYTDSSEWNRINKAIDSEQGAPIFFRVQNNEIKDFGLAYLYKLPYKKSPYDTLSEKHKQKTNLDLAECIFGTSQKNVALKGRVTFGHAFCTNEIKHNELIFTMGSPKASYYPIYIEQKSGVRGKTKPYSTYNDSKIRGWKRYQIRESLHGYKRKEDYSETLDTKLIPLNKGSTFECTVRFHNLRPAELGALYSALTFHQTEECNHQIGHGKAFGLGALKIDVTDINTNVKIKTDEILADFEGLITEAFNEEWHKSEQIKNLFTIAGIPVLSSQNENYNYMNMSVDKNIRNEFEDAKKRKEYLRSYPELQKRSIIPNSHYQRILKERLERQRQEEEERRKEEERKEEERFQLKKQALKEAEEQRKREAAERRKHQIQEGLAFLDDKYDDGRYKVTNFKGINNRVGQWLDKAKHTELPTEEHETLTRNLERVYSTANKREQKQWLNFEKGVWNNIIGWLGKEKAEELFKKLIN